MTDNIRGGFAETLTGEVIAETFRAVKVYDPKHAFLDTLIEAIEKNTLMVDQALADFVRDEHMRLVAESLKPQPWDKMFTAIAKQDSAIAGKMLEYFTGIVKQNNKPSDRGSSAPIKFQLAMDAMKAIIEGQPSLATEELYEYLLGEKSGLPKMILDVLNRLRPDLGEVDSDPGRRLTRLQFAIAGLSLPTP